MTHSSSRNTIALLTSVMLAACNSTAKTTTEQSLETCPEVRPEICTMDYNPVCGNLANNEQRTYSNGCTACADTQVVGYTPGECR